MAYDIACQIKYKDETPEKAINNSLLKLQKIGGEGGVIMIAENGEIYMPFISKAMFRGSYKSTENKIFTTVF